MLEDFDTGTLLEKKKCHFHPAVPANEERELSATEMSARTTRVCSFSLSLGRHQHQYVPWSVCAGEIINSCYVLSMGVWLLWRVVFFHLAHAFPPSLCLSLPVSLSLPPSLSLTNTTVVCDLFADGNSTHSCGKAVESVQSCLQECYNVVSKWRHQNRMVIHPGKNKGMAKAARQVSSLVSWYFEPSQPQRITPGLKTMFNLSPIYSARQKHQRKPLILKLVLVASYCCTSS